MSNPALQAKAQALNAKMEGEARVVLDQMERTQLRTFARKSYACVVQCFDKAGSTGPSDVLEQCSRQCQVPYQQANMVVQEEANQFQNRLSRAMMDCNDKAKDMLTPGMENDPSKIAKVEEKLLSCISRTVDEHVQMLKPMKKRIEGKLKEFK